MISAKDHIQPARVPLMLTTAWTKVPDYWRIVIAPKIVMVKESPCWFWIGALDGEGAPVARVLNPETGRHNTVRLKRTVAAMFWDLERHHDVVQACGNTNCLHPRHFYVTAVHYQQHDREGILRRMRAEIKHNFE